MTDSANDSGAVPGEGTSGQTGHQSSVLVVGAGPTGLLLGSKLWRRGVPCHLIDARRAPLHWDRATVVHPRSLEVFESLGLVGRFLDRTGADLLGVQGITLLVVRPDGYIGMRCGRDHLGGLDRYRTLVDAGHP